MTDDRSPELDSPQADDAAAERVRRLLADARADEPMPADVAARMQDVLAGLSPSEVEQPETARAADDAPLAEAVPVVVPLDVRRRRRAGALLVAAAAIVVGGVVIAQHLPEPSGDLNGSAAGGSAAEDRGTVKSPGSDSLSAVPSPQQPGASLSMSDGPDRPVVRHGRVVVRPDQFAADAYAARRLAAKTPASSSAYSAQERVGEGCVAAPVGADVVRASYRGAPAALVFHAPVSNSQVVDLYLCGTDRALRSVTLPHP